MTSNAGKKRPRPQADDDCVWDEMFDTLVHFGIQHSHCNVPADYVLDGGRYDGKILLGYWLSQQLILQKTCSLRPERLEKLQVSFTNRSWVKVAYQFMLNIHAWFATEKDSVG